MGAYDACSAGELEEYEYPEAEIARALEHLPRVGVPSPRPAVTRPLCSQQPARRILASVTTELLRDDTAHLVRLLEELLALCAAPDLRPPPDDAALRALTCRSAARRRRRR
jgi:hypothetical protein